MVRIHLVFGWTWILAGLLAGTVEGLFFHRDEWLDGYASWSRRLSRLGHVAFVGTGLLNVAFALTVRALSLPSAGLAWTSALLLGGAVAMPLVCLLASWRKPFRHLFALPVVLLLAGVGGFAWVLFRSSGGDP
jgi:hypothetical protein